MKGQILPRPPQTKIKHTILGKYLLAWGGIIINGRKSTAKTMGQAFDLHLVYVDCNASNGRYDGEDEEAAAGRSRSVVWGSPIIGVRGLDALTSWAFEKYGIKIRTNSILIEKEAKEFENLKASLEMAGLSSRVRETTDFDSLRDTEIAIVRADSTKMADKLLAYTQKNPYTLALFFLDPYGPKGIPMHFVSQIIQASRHDVIINMPYQDLHKKSGIVGKEETSAVEKELIENYNIMFGHTTWQALTAKTGKGAKGDGGEAGNDLEEELMTCYGNTLQDVDQSLTVKKIPLHFPDRERTMFYLYLTTHDTSGAYAMNKLLYEAGYQETELKMSLKDAKKQVHGQMMFDLSTVSTKPLRPETEEVAEVILKQLAGKRLTLRAALKILVNSTYFVDEIRSALSHLRETDRVIFTPPLQQDTVITFSRFSS